MSRYIDAEAIIEKKWQAESEACFYALEDVVSVTDIEEAPYIDIVFCKECKHCEYADMKLHLWCNKQERYIYADDYCSFGERSE